MVKALYVLPIAAFAAIAFANCSKTESESTQNFTYDQALVNQLPKDRFDGSVKFEGFDENGNSCMLVKEADGTVRMATDEELSLKIGVEQLIPENEKEIPTNEIFLIVEEMPEFPGGEEALRKYIADNVKFPDEAKANGQEGKVFVQFIIDKNGDAKDVEIVNGTGIDCLDNEAIRVVKSMPQWKPGRQRGQNVNVSFTVPINFQLN